MPIHLTAQIESLIQEKVDGDRYATADQVVAEALHALEERDRLVRLRTAIAVGDEHLARGEVVKWTPELWAQLDREADEEDHLGLPISDDVRP